MSRVLRGTAHSTIALNVRYFNRVAVFAILSLPAFLSRLRLAAVFANPAPVVLGPLLESVQLAAKATASVDVAIVIFMDDGPNPFSNAPVAVARCKFVIASVGPDLLAAVALTALLGVFH